MKRLTSLLLAFCLILSLCACGGNTGATTEPEQNVPATETTVPTTEPAETIPQETGTRILRNCSDSPYNAFYTSHAPSTITSITFLDKIDPIVGINGTHVSQDNDRSVFACVVEEGEEKHLYLYGKGGIRAPEDCSHLFAEYVNLKYIDFADCFDTSNVTNMQGMFMNCKSLETLDLGCFDTSSVQDMSFMFSGCSSLQDVNLNSFDTHNVQFMDHMFYGADTLSNVDIPDLDVERLADIKDFMSGNCTLNGQPWKSTQSSGDPSVPLHDGTVFTQGPDELIASILDRLETQFDIYYDLSTKQEPQEHVAVYTLIPSGENLYNRPDLEFTMIAGKDSDTVASILLNTQQNAITGNQLSISTVFEVYYALLGKNQQELIQNPPPLTQVASSPALIMNTAQDGLCFSALIFLDTVMIDLTPENSSAAMDFTELLSAVK